MFNHLEGVIKFTLEPANPSYARNGSSAKLVWDYSVDDKQKELQGILFSVEVRGIFTRMLVQLKNGTVVEHPAIPSAYKGRVRNEGNATLVIENVSPQDSRVFRCELSPESGQIQTSGVQLIVTGAYLQANYNVLPPSQSRIFSKIKISILSGAAHLPSVSIFDNEESLIEHVVFLTLKLEMASRGCQFSK